MLHALSLYNPYGVVASLMSPLSAGGRVVLLPQFDANKVWSHLLGIGDQVPRIDAFAGVPIHYESLINRYQEIFKVNILYQNVCVIDNPFFFIGFQAQRFCP